MKLISLNTWGGKAGREKILDFFARYKDADIFCLQEMWSGGGEEWEGRMAGAVPIEGIVYTLFSDVSNILSSYTSYFRPQFQKHYGLAIFIKKDFKVLEEGEIYVYKEKGYYSEEDLGDHGRSMQYIVFETPAGKRMVANLHGLWNGTGKGDTVDRLLQSDKIIDFLKTRSEPLVLCGDFNLLPDARSVKKLEDFGLCNLIAEYGITNTRSSVYTKPERYADYAFVSDGVRVKDFWVLPDEVSDHLALFLDFE